MVQHNSYNHAEKRRVQGTLPMLKEVEIIYSAPRFDSAVKITASKNAYDILLPIFKETRKMELKELFYVLLLNRANYVLGYSCIGVGSNAGVAVNILELFQLAIKTNSTGIILCHNHPSNSTKPSQADLDFTRKITAGCKLLDLNLLDHIIITSQLGYTSMADEGLL